MKMCFWFNSKHCYRKKALDALDVLNMQFALSRTIKLLHASLMTKRVEMKTGQQHIPLDQIY